VGLSHATSRGSPFANRIVQYRLEDLSVVATHTMPLGSGPVGVGVSFDGSIWAIYQDNDMASRFDPATGSWIEHPVGLNPYTYSDFVGFGLNVFAEPRGHHRFIVEGCADAESQWQGVRYDATVPDRTRVEVWARSADTVADLETETFLGPFEGNPANLQAVPGPVPPRRYLQVELRLVTMDRSTSPRILDVDVALVCVGSLG
ncbi:MAG: hypothetical protein OEY14_18965, partial [Myxococcales bacterium]|nr:hypothetical protein [Myxococcales bacterium]